MVSVLKIGPNIAFNAKNSNIAFDKPTDKAKIKAVANNQVNLGYAVMGAGLLAMAGAGLKKGALKYIAPLPATCVCMMLGGNMMAAGNAVKKAVDAPVQQKPTTVDTKA